MLVSMERTFRVVARAGTSLWRTVGVLSEADLWSNLLFHWPTGWFTVDVAGTPCWSHFLSRSTPVAVVTL